jgi:hypothetical protein
VNSLTRGLGLSVLGLAMLGATGCGVDNESEAEKLSKGLGDPGAMNPNTKKDENADLPQSNSPAERHKQRESQNAMGPGYPLAKKK